MRIFMLVGEKASSVSGRYFISHQLFRRASCHVPRTGYANTSRREPEVNSLRPLRMCSYRRSICACARRRTSGGVPIWH